MALLEKIRVKFGWVITLIIGVALLSFIIDPNTLQSVTSMFSSRYDVGEIDGKAINVQEYQKHVDYYTNIYQMTSGGRGMNDQMQEQLQANAWQDMITGNVILPIIDNAGVKVGVEELYELSQGKNVSPIIAREFQDENGVFDRARLVEFIQSITLDESGHTAAYWEFLKKNMIEQQLYSKYMSLFAKSSAYVNNVELKRAVGDNNITSNVDFVLVPFGFQTDTSIVVTNGEIAKYYNNNKEIFKQEYTRNAEYVVVEVAPSEKDIEDARFAVERVLPEFEKATNLNNFVTKNSDTPFSPFFFTRDEIKEFSPVVEDFIVNNKVKNAAMPITQVDDSFISVRVSAKKMMSDSAFVQHIAFSPMDNVKVDSLMNVLQKNSKVDFSALALQYSLDQNPNVENPGDLGWFKQENTTAIPGLDTVLVMQAGGIVKIATPQSIHIMKIKERSTPVEKMQLAIITKEIVPSKATFQTYFSKANEVAAKSVGDASKLRAVADELGLDVHPAFYTRPGSKRLGSYDGVKEVTKWIFNAKVGDVSKVIDINNQYFFVVTVTGINEDGYRSLASATPEIESMLRYEKMKENKANEVRNQIAGLTSIDAVAEKLGVTVSKNQAVPFGAIMSQGFEPAFIGAATGANEGVISGPVAGQVGVYVFKVNSREVGNFFTEDDEKLNRNRYTSNQMNRLPQVMMEKANIKDERYKFF